MSEGMAMKKKNESHWYRFNSIIDLFEISISLIGNLSPRLLLFSLIGVFQFIIVVWIWVYAFFGLCLEEVNNELNLDCWWFQFRLECSIVEVFLNAKYVETYAYCLYWFLLLHSFVVLVCEFWIHFLGVFGVTRWCIIEV